MWRMKRISLFLLVLLLGSVVYSANKSDRLRPQWVTKQIPESKSGTYIFVRTQGTGSSLESARQNSVVDLRNHLETERNLKINSVFEVNSTTNTTSQFSQKSGASSSYTYRQTDNYNMQVTENGLPLNLICRVIDEYWVQKDGLYIVDVLYTVADQNKYGGSYDDNITTTTKYGAAGLLSIIPGAGQMYKGDMAKGISFLVVDVACASGIVLCECTRAAYAAKITQQPQYAQQYSTRANNWSTGRNICIGVTAGIWLWNIIDAFAAKGARRVKVKPNKGYVTMTPSYQVNPITCTIDQGFGIAYHF